MDSRQAITEFLFLRDEPGKVDLCFVLGSRYPETMDNAIKLWKQGLTARILISGHGPEEDQAKEADIFATYALSAGVPEEALIIEREARNTRDNFVFSKPLVSDWDTVQTVAIVGKPYHMRRALMTARKHWPVHIRYVMLPSNLKQDLKATDWWQSEWGRFRIMDELRRIGGYAISGDLGDF